jgi:sortase A
MVAGVLAIALWQFGQTSYLHAKARLAQYLVRAAWERTLAGEREVKPWPWADHWPVARLIVPHRGAEIFVMAGASVRAIAFGAGHVSGTALPGASGTSVIAARRDTPSGLLRSLQAGDALVVETPDGVRRHYVVDDTAVIDRRDLRAARPEPVPRLTLVAGYPVDAARPRGSLHYVVRAVGV